MPIVREGKHIYTSGRVSSTLAHNQLMTSDTHKQIYDSFRWGGSFRTFTTGVKGEKELSDQSEKS